MIVNDNEMNIQNIITPRLQVRPIQVSDATDVIEILGDRETAELGAIDPITDMDAALDYATGENPGSQKLVMVCGQGKPEVVGIIELYPASNLLGPFCIDGSYCLGYYTRKNQRGKGFMTEAVNALKCELFERGIPELTVGIFPRNEASKRVALKCGLTYDFYVEDFLVFDDGRKEDIEFFSQTNPNCTAS